MLKHSEHHKHWSTKFKSFSNIYLQVRIISDGQHGCQWPSCQMTSVSGDLSARSSQHIMPIWLPIWLSTGTRFYLWGTVCDRLLLSTRVQIAQRNITSLGWNQTGLPLHPGHQWHHGPTIYPSRASIVKVWRCEQITTQVKVGSISLFLMKKTL